MSGEEKLPQVKGVAFAGENAVILTFESGEMVTVTARDGTTMSPEGILFTDWRNNGPVYFIPSPHHRWQAKVLLGLYNSEPDSEEARFDKYLMCLTSIVEVSKTDGVLTLGYTKRNREQGICQFSGEVSVHFTDDLSEEDFTRFPVRVFIHEGRGDNLKIIGFRVDHTPAGHAVLAALRDGDSLPPLGTEA